MRGEQQELLLQPSALEDDEPEWDADQQRRRSAPWLIAAAVALVVITIFVLYGMLHHSGSAKGSAAATAPAAAGAAARSSAAVRTAPGAVTQSAAPAAARTAPSATPAAADAAGWRVVAYTYDHRRDAEHKAKTLANRYPRLAPKVFAPRGGGRYLVTLGPEMSRAEAFRMRSEAVRMGLPRDTYAQNFR